MKVAGLKVSTVGFYSEEYMLFTNFVDEGSRLTRSDIEGFFARDEMLARPDPLVARVGIVDGV
jgi:hypothetical protein